MKKISENDIIKDVETGNLDMPQSIVKTITEDAKLEATLLTMRF